MIVVSASMPKSGSGWLHGLTTGLLSVHDIPNITALGRMYDLDGLVFGRNGRVHQVEEPIMKRLMAIHDDGHSFAVKTHSPPTGPLIAAAQAESVRAIYIFRDPRDAMLSALEHGARTRKAGRNKGGFSHFRTLSEVCSAWQGRWLPCWAMWISQPWVLKVRYEELLVETHAIVGIIASYLGLPTDDGALQEIVQRYSAGRAQGDDALAGRMHLNKGRCGRHREVFTLEEQQILLDSIGPWLEVMGYDTTLGSQEGPGLGAHVSAIETPPRAEPVASAQRRFTLTAEQIARL